MADVNVLLALVYPPHQHHQITRQWFNRQEVESVGICRFVQLGMLRLLTNPAAMREDVCSQKEAWELLDELGGNERMLFLGEPEGLESHLRSFTRDRKSVNTSWTDAYLAAFALASDMGVATFDKGFRSFGVTIAGPK